MFYRPLAILFLFIWLIRFQLVGSDLTIDNFFDEVHLLVKSHMFECAIFLFIVRKCVLLYVLECSLLDPTD